MPDWWGSGTCPVSAAGADNLSDCIPQLQWKSLCGCVEAKMVVASNVTRVPAESVRSARAPDRA